MWGYLESKGKSTVRRRHREEDTAWYNRDTTTEDGGDQFWEMITEPLWHCAPERQEARTFVHQLQPLHSWGCPSTVNRSPRQVGHLCHLRDAQKQKMEEAWCGTCQGGSPCECSTLSTTTAAKARGSQRVLKWVGKSCPLQDPFGTMLWCIFLNISFKPKRTKFTKFYHTHGPLAELLALLAEFTSPTLPCPTSVLLVSRY